MEYIKHQQVVHNMPFDSLKACGSGCDSAHLIARRDGSFQCRLLQSHYKEFDICKYNSTSIFNIYNIQRFVTG